MKYIKQTLCVYFEVSMFSEQIAVHLSLCVISYVCYVSNGN